MVASRERVEVVPFNKFSPIARLAASVIHEKITHLCYYTASQNYLFI